jgi:ribosomal protein L11 methyltransferase
MNLFQSLSLSSVCDWQPYLWCIDEIFCNFAHRKVLTLKILLEMNDYREVRIDMKPCSEDATDLLAALLADVGFESFVPDDNGLTAYVREEDFNREAINLIVADFPMHVSMTVHDNFVEGQDWNAEWEKNYFKPIVVGNKCAIYSSFHTDVPEAQYRIVIDPKMAFGTGHHATTSQVISALLNLDLKGKAVIDMGTGTGILAILSSMLGATNVTGIEIDEFAYTNAVENVRLNNQADIKLINGDASALAGIDPVDVFVANINRNIITGDIDRYAKALKSGGVMLLSGFYVEDIPVIMAAAEPLGLSKDSFTEDKNWTCLKLVKK